MEEDFDAIEEFNRWRNKESKDLLDGETLICECICVSVLDIRELLKHNRKVDLKVLKEQLSIGQGCSGCTKSFEQWKNKIF